jgi:hypothetical protein
MPVSKLPRREVGRLLPSGVGCPTVLFASVTGDGGGALAGSGPRRLRENENSFPRFRRWRWKRYTCALAMSRSHVTVDARITPAVSCVALN